MGGDAPVTTADERRLIGGLETLSIVNMKNVKNGHFLKNPTMKHGFNFHSWSQISNWLIASMVCKTAT